MRLDPGVVISEAIKTTRAAMMFRNACARHFPHIEIADVVLPHQRDGLRLQHLIAIAAAPVQNHLREFDVVAGRAIKPAAAHVEFRILLEFEWDRR